MTTDEYTPTVDDLREVADFIRRRGLDEAQGAGVMQSNRDHGVTIRIDVPKNNGSQSHRDETRQTVTNWLDEHSPDRFMYMAHQLACLADRLADTGVDYVYDLQQRPALSPYRVQAVWSSLTGAARLWDQHPDFKPLWAKDEDAES